MSKLGDIFLLSQQVSVAAGEECTRLGNPQIDVDHLLLALLVTDGVAGRRLRDLGITLDPARAAVATVHSDRAARLGVQVPAAPPGLIDPAAVEQVDWSPRALKLMRSLPSYSNDLPLLQALLDEPSRLPLQILHTLGVAEATARAAAGMACSPAVSAAQPTAPETLTEKEKTGWRTVTHTGFAPVPPEQVWALITDPTRRVEWDYLTVAATQPDSTHPSVVELTARTTTSTGRPSRTRTDPTRMRQTIIKQEPRDIEWETTWPDATHSPVLRLAIHLEPTAGGTRLELRSRWRRRPGTGGLLRLPLLPLVKFGMRQQLINRAAGISRAVR